MYKRETQEQSIPTWKSPLCQENILSHIPSKGGRRQMVGSLPCCCNLIKFFIFGHCQKGYGVRQTLGLTQYE